MYDAIIKDACVYPKIPFGSLLCRIFTKAFGEISKRIFIDKIISSIMGFNKPVKIFSQQTFSHKILHSLSPYPVLVSLVLLRLYAYLGSLLDLDVYYQKIIYAREKLTFDKIKAKKIPTGGVGTKKAARAG